MELKSMEAGQKTHSESPMMELIEVNGSWAEDTLGEPDDGILKCQELSCLQKSRPPGQSQ
jgi:hypothetical protein